MDELPMCLGRIGKWTGLRYGNEVLLQCRGINNKNGGIGLSKRRVE